MNRSGKQEQDLCIVCIGASAGGLEAIQEFFTNIVESAGMAFVVIQHFSSEYKSMLVELLQKGVSMKVCEAVQDAELEESAVYVIPNNKLMTIRGNRLLLSERVPDKMPNMAIDHFLFTLAAEKGAGAVAVVLSGTGADGTKGSQAVKEAGGLVLVQDPDTAAFNGMPVSAIVAGFIDYVLPPRSMPEEISIWMQEAPHTLWQQGKRGERHLKKIEELIHQQTELDFGPYKKSTILRRIAQRMGHLNLGELADYEQYLQSHPEEIEQLYHALLIGVTRFFRDQAAFDELTQKVLPAIVENKGEGEGVKIWVCACSTGEEAYSIAILFDQYLQRNGLYFDIKVFATDVDGKAVEIAARGSYPADAFADLPADFLEGYFTQDADQYTIIPRIRRQIVFARHNVFKDPPFIKNDLITCRNLLIYMNNPVQKKVLETFHFALKHKGFLFLGASENISPIRTYMEEISQQWKIFKKIKSRALSFIQPGDQGKDKTGAAQASKWGDAAGMQNKSAISLDFTSTLAEEFGFAGLYIDKNFCIREALGNYKRYLQLPDDKFDLSVLKMAPPDLARALHTAVYASWQDGKKIHMHNVEVGEGPTRRKISITVKPSLQNRTEYTFVALGEAMQTTEEATEDGTALVLEAQQAPAVFMLETELNETRYKLQKLEESFESSNEELQSTNEELLSSIEELQSLNEELHTLNGEHQLKIKELIDLNDDLNNYFRSSDIGQIFVDASMRIRKFNPAVTKTIQVSDADVGKDFSHVSTHLRDASVVADLETVINNATPVEKEVALRNGDTVLVRIIPYLRQDKKADGAIITLIDITAIKYLNSVLAGTFNSSLNAIMAFRVVRDSSNQITDFILSAANYASDALLNRPHEKALQLSMQNDFPHLCQHGLFDRYVQVVENNWTLHTEESVHPQKQELYYEIVAVKTPYGISIAFNDISEKKEAQDRLHKNYNELLIVKENLKKVNAEMEEKVLERTKDLSDKEERFRMVAKATNDTFWDWNLADSSMWWSENFTLVFGYEATPETLNRTFWSDHIHPDDSQQVKESIFSAINSNREQWSAEYRFQKADGSYAEILDRAYILKDEYQTPYRMLGSMLDVTNLKRAEAEASNSIAQKNFLAQAMPLSVWMASPDGKITFLNQQFSRYTGMDSAELMDVDWKAIVHPDDLPELTKAWHTALANRTDFAIEVRIKRKDDVYRWQLVRAKARVEDDNTLTFWVGTNTDIHAQKMATETMEQQVKERTQELQHSNRQLEESNHELQQYAYVASHDLKEPVRKINMFGNILKTKFLQDQDEKVRDYMDRIINSSMRMMRLIDDLLNFSNLSLTELFKPTDLNKTLQDILSDLELSIQEKNAVVEVSELPTIEAVPAQMRQVFQNLISNALKFSKPEVQPRIRVWAEFTEELSLSSPAVTEGPYCRMVVEDNGIGFDEIYLSKIFTLFQRLHSREFEGTGIGLAVVQKIISKHNGLISARSQENKGATFILVLPVKQE